MLTDCHVSKVEDYISIVEYPSNLHRSCIARASALHQKLLVEFIHPTATIAPIPIVQP